MNVAKKRETIKNFEEQEPQNEVKKRNKSRGEVRKGYGSTGSAGSLSALPFGLQE